MFLPELPVIKEFENCGKRYRRSPLKPKDYSDPNPDRKNFAECFWNCEVHITQYNIFTFFNYFFFSGKIILCTATHRTHLKS